MARKSLIGHFWLKRLLIIGVAALLLATVAGSQLTPPPSLTKRGLFQVLWGDPRGGRQAVGPIYLLGDDQGTTTELVIAEELLRPLGGPGNLNRRRVVVTGDPEAVPSLYAAARIRVRNIQLEQAVPVTKRGWFVTIWGTPTGRFAGTVGPIFLLQDEQGTSTELSFDAEVVRPFGGPRGLNRRRVVVIGDPDPTPSAHAQARVRVRDIQLEQPEPSTGPQAVTGSQPWVTILCRFSDSTGVTPHDLTWFQTLMGNTAPGMDHFWRELSYNTINLIGSTVVGWYNLPQPRSYYVYDQNGDGQPDLDFGRATNDCTAVADADVFFPNFSGINLMFNQDLDCCAWGGGSTLTRDGQTKFYSMTWMPPWGYNNQSVFGQEMGHGFGLPHSSGPYTATYDSKWDVQSGGGTCSPQDANYGCVGVHTVSYHKDSLSWIPSNRKYVAAANSSQTIEIERLAQPVSSINYLMAHIPIGGSTTQFYTVEARKFVGYDIRVPGEAIVIHKVDTTRGDRRAQVVDADNNGNPNDAGAMWLAGESFTDPAAGVSVTVNSASTSSFNVTIGLAPPPPPANDNFAGATIIAAVPYTTAANAISATTEGTDPTPSCGNNSRQKSVWYKFTPPSNTTLIANTFGSGYDTILSVYTGSPGSFLQVACNDNAAGGLQSQVSFSATAGITYSFMISSYSGAGGALIFSLQEATPTVTTSAATGVASTTATLNGTVNPNGLTTNAWFEWGTSPTLSSFNSTPTQAIGSGTGAVAINAGLSGLSANTTYYFRAAASNSLGTSRGAILSFSTGAPNDNFANATVISTPPFADTVNTSAATIEGTDPNPSCDFINTVAKTVWYRFTPAANTTLTASTLGSNYDTVLVAYTGSPGSFTEVACNDQFNGNQSQITFSATAGTTYHFFISAWDGIGGVLVFKLSNVGPLTTTLPASPVTLSSATLNGTVNPGELPTLAWFEYGTNPALSSPNFTDLQSVGSGLTAVPISASLTGLRPATTYYFRAAALNSSGTAKGSILSFRTRVMAQTLVTRDSPEKNNQSPHRSPPLRASMAAGPARAGRPARLEQAAAGHRSRSTKLW